MYVLSVMAAMVLAVVTPRDATLRVHDFANLLSPAQRESLESLSQSVERQTTAQLAIVTVRSLDGQTIDSYANELFNQWGIGQKGLNNGVLLLVAPNERRMRIEVGYGVEPLLTDSLCGEIRDQQVIPQFKRGDYPGGIIAGAERLAHILRSDPKAARGDPDSGPALARKAKKRAFVAIGGVAIAAVVLIVSGLLVVMRRLYSTTEFMVASAIGLAALAVAAYFVWDAPNRLLPMGWFNGAAAAALAAWCFNLVKYRRFGPHGCSKCGTQLELLSEQDDDPKLTSVQRLEEKIGSVDYDVWICPACLNSDTERYVKAFSGFTDCPACKARTYKEDPQEMIRAATTTSSGTARVDGRCVACNHKGVRFVTLPKISTSSGSGSGFGGGGGGGGFGGGSSGGGGASGGW